jgi:cobalt-zinc-cadmium efflux system outer membrane protein
VHRSKILFVTCALLALAGCGFQKYRPAPLSPQATAATLEARTLSDAGLRAFVEKNAPNAASAWPRQQWDLAHLTLAAFYFNPALEVARARVSEAEAAVVTSGARPNPSTRGDAGAETAPENPWIAGLGFSIPVETAGKRERRISVTERRADVARWNLAITAWTVRAQVRSALVEYIAAERDSTLVKAEEHLRAEQVHLVEQRLAVGMIPRPEVDAARIADTQAILAVQAAEGRVAQAETSLAAAIGLPASALNGVQLSWPGFDCLPDPASLTAAKIQEDAVLNRLDIRRALAEYSAAEAALRLEVAKQYPDVDIGPDYAFEEGAHLFSVAAALVLPIVNRNQGPIGEALARRDEIAAQFLSTQASGIAASEQALAKYNAALKQIGTAQQLMQQSQAQEQATQKALQAGQSDRVALNAAQLQTAVVAVAHADAISLAQQALGDLENAVQHPLLPGDLEPLSPQAPVLQAPQRKTK